MTKIIIQNRNSEFDVLKVILIILVILGHWLEYGLGNYLNRVVFNYIYLFHMPLFILISGYFSKKTDKKTFKRKIFSYIETYTIVQILYVISANILQGKSITLSILYTPNAAAWYLLSLITWRTILQIIPTRLLKSRKNIYISLIISVVSGFLPINNNEFSLLRTLTFLPFFIYGFALKDGIVKMNNPLKNWMQYCILLGILFLTFIVGDKDLSSVLYGKYSFYNHSYSPFFMMILRICFLSIAFIMSNCIIKTIHNHTYIHTTLGSIGRNSIVFYVYHIIFLRVFIILIRHFDLPMSFIPMIAYTFITIIILYLISLNNIPKRLLTPINSLLYKK